MLIVFRYGALTALYRLVRAFKYKSSDERVALDEAMKFLHPLLLQRMQELLPDSSEASVSLIKLILKIFCCYVQYDFPQKVLNLEVFEQWMETIRRVLDSPVPSKVSGLGRKCSATCVITFPRFFMKMPVTNSQNLGEVNSRLNFHCEALFCLRI